jgi:N6-L-threonylcarbamoyladenine synthase
MKYFLGIDTSCYTSSMAIADEDECILLNIKKQLVVEKGQRGLRQSDGVFQHLKNLPDIFSQTAPYKNICCVAASTRPRPQLDSYMPVFVAADTIGKIFAGAKDAQFFASTHQHAHIYAAMIGQPDADGDYLGLHISGGTTEILKISVKRGLVHEISLLGGTIDITAGQLLDRIGVKMGMVFPAGAEIETTAKDVLHTPFSLPVTVKGTNANFSGAETQALRAIELGIEKEQICRMVFDCICQTLGMMIKHAKNITGINRIFLFGGVCSSQILKEYIEKELLEIQAIFAGKEYAGDNAAGLSILAKRMYFMQIQNQKLR